MVEEAQLITKIKTAFPKEESEHKDIHGTELVAVAVGILLSLAFITYSNSSSFFIMLVICLMGGFFGYLTVRGTQTLVSFAPLAFKLFYAARHNAVLRRSPFPSP